MTDNIYTTSRGVAVKFVGIASLIDKLNGEFKEPKKPQYSATSKITGVTEYFDHDETTINTPEEKTAWAEYQRQLAETIINRNRAVMRATLMAGLSVDMPDNDDWIKQHEFYGFKVPSDPMERKLHYLETEVIGSVQDYQQIVIGVQRASGVSEESLSQMAESFRGSMGKLGGDGTEKPTLSENRQDMVFQSTIRTSGNGVRDGHGAKRIRRAK